jgi:hydrogenase nickel incorporation protein HypA/HybF
MHELSICQALIDQVEDLAREHGAVAIHCIHLQVGPLSGVEIPLLENAYPLAAAGTVAEQAELVIEAMPIRVRCSTCGAESEATANRLICATCKDYHTELISGDEMILSRLEFDRQAV